MADELSREIELARAAQRRGSYRAAGADGAVEAEVDGTYHLKKLEIDVEALGAGAGAGAGDVGTKRLEAAVAEAVNAAIDKARRRARGRLDKALASRQVS